MGDGTRTGVDADYLAADGRPVRCVWAMVVGIRPMKNVSNDILKFRRVSIRVPAKRIAVVILASLFAGACGGAAASDAVTNAQPVVARAIAVGAGCDVSLSYNMAEQCAVMLAGAVQQELRPGDSLFVRFIQTHSYDESAAFCTLRLPLVPAMPANPYDRSGRSKVRQAQQRIEALRGAAVRRLSEFRVAEVQGPERSGTDIYGFLAKAAELFSNAGDVDKVLTMGTDLISNQRQQIGNASLSGARVVIFYFQNGADVSQARRRKQFWTDELKRFGAGEVMFMDPSEGAGNGLFRQPARSE